jgi:8-oxo-dGTP pyrophosphatase MutT (NUDIX family)
MTKDEILKLYPDVYINESDGSDAYRPEENIVERNPIAVIIKHPKDNLFLLAKWNNGWCGFLTGGIEEGDTLEDTVHKEILEETGFKNVGKIEVLDCVCHGLFYHTVKKVNRLAHYHLVFAELINLEQKIISEEELSIASFLWISKENVEEKLTTIEMKKLWMYYVEKDI